MAQGVYTENLIVDKRVTLQGGYESGGWTRSITQYETIIDGRGSVVSQSVIIFQTDSNGTVLDGFTLRNGESKFGGGAYIDNTVVTISDTTFVSNTAEYGGGLAVGVSAAATIVSCQFISNTASYQAGGLRGDGNVTIEDSVFQGNSAQENGGAIQSQGLVVRRSRILSNSASNGGGVDVFGSALLEDVEIVGNVAIHQGGDVAGEIFNPFELEELGPIIDLDQMASLLQSDSKLKYLYKDTNKLDYSCGTNTHLGDGSLLYADVPQDDPIAAPTYNVYAPIKFMPVRITWNV